MRESTASTCLSDALKAKSARDGQPGFDYDRSLAAAFEHFPDTYDALRVRELAYFRYVVRDEGRGGNDDARPRESSELIRRGSIVCDPIVYEDFFPISAAGIFRFNLGERKPTSARNAEDRELFEHELGRRVIDEHGLYVKMEESSLGGRATPF